MALGNIVGSNIFNVLLILGLSALICPLIVAQRLLWWDVPLMIGFGLLLLLLGLDGTIGHIDGLVLSLCLIAYMWWAIQVSRCERKDGQEEFTAAGEPVPLDGVTLLIGVVRSCRRRHISFGFSE